MKTYYSELLTSPLYSDYINEYFKEFHEKHEMINYIVRDLTGNYYEKVRDSVTPLKQTLGEDQVQEEYSNDTFVGKFSHMFNIIERIDALKFYITNIHSQRFLTLEHMASLWKAMVIKPNFLFETRQLLLTIS